MGDQKQKAGRPTHVAEYVKGEEAAANFERAMKAIISVPREVILEAEREKNQPKRATN